MLLMVIRDPLKNLRDELSSRRFETNASLRATAENKPLAPYGETLQAKVRVDNSPLSKVSIRELPKGKLRDYGNIRIKNQSSQFVANSSVHTMHGQVIKDVPESDGVPRDPAWKANAPKVAKARPDSPFKRAGKSAASVVIVRK